MEKKEEVSETAKGTFEEIELAGDLQKYLESSKDAKVATTLKNEIINYPPKVLLSVEKRISSPIEIVSVKVVDDAFIANAFPNLNH